jgi:uncharacterized repeat protein (TIGR01451 family)
MTRVHKLSYLRWLAGCCLLFLATFSMAQTATVSGRIGHFQSGFPSPEAAGVIVIAYNNSEIVGRDTTDTAGLYDLVLPINQSYMITCVPDRTPSDLGVTTYDAALIRNHIDGTEILNESQLQRADVDLSGIININDIIHIRKYLLGIEPLPVCYIFGHYHQGIQPGQALATNVPIPDLTNDISNIDFIPLALGDINFTDLGYSNLLFFNPVYVSGFSGRVSADINSNCLAEDSEVSLPGWLVEVTDQSTQVKYYSTTNSLGYYSMYCPWGEYQIRALAPNQLWENCDPTQSTISPITLSSITTHNISSSPVVNCPALEVNLGTGILRRCFENQYVVNYANQGTATAIGAYVKVTLDPLFEYLSSSIPVAQVIGNDYYFMLGDVGVGQSGSFTIQFTVSCDSDLGQTHCTSAHIFPDTICGVSTLTIPQLTLSAECAGDEVIFTITNNGASMTEAVDYVVIEDVMVQKSTGSIQLAAGASQTVVLPADGATLRMELEQVAGFPLPYLITESIEGCGTSASGTTSQGIITQFSLDDEAPYIDEDCRENVGAFDPNDKQGFPRGMDEERRIRPGQPLDYLIRFQNTGTDTAFTVVILDTLDTQVFDMTTLRPGPSSHNCLYEILGTGVIRWTFNNIMLPDSNVNEAASHGFVKFMIQPKMELPYGTTIRNSAAIYFDFNEPIITNQTLHTINELYPSAVRPDLKARPVQIIPNPASDRLTIVTPKLSESTEGQLLLYNSQGRLVHTQRTMGHTHKIDIARLPQGIYAFEILTSNHSTASGRFVINR